MARRAQTEDVFVDVFVEIDEAEYAAKGAAGGQWVLELCRAKADELCASHGAALRTDRAPEMQVKLGRHRLLNIDMLLVSSRWAATAPRSVLAHTLN